MAHVMVLAVACGHGRNGPGVEENIGEQKQATTLTWPPTPVVSAGKVGMLPGGGGVGPAGDYHYTLPIEVPVGRAGMTPSLSLSYSSTAGNDLVGVGWTLNGGMSVITACNKTIAADGVAEPDSSMCLDGERLVKVGPEDYRTASNGFARVTDEIGNHNRYKVELQDGRVRYYTHLHRSELFNRLTYALELEEDADGNGIYYTYTQLPGSTSVPFELHLDRIDYGVKSDLSYPSVHTRHIKFNYDEHRPDPIHSDTELFDYEESKHTAGLNTKTRSVATTRRLSSIYCYAPGVTSETTTAQLAWTYDLAYIQSTTSGRSLLGSVKRTGALGGQSYAKEFSWDQTKGGVFASGSSFGSFGGDPNFELTSIDVDNDGKDELLVAMPSAGFFTPLLFSTDTSGPLLGHTKVLTGLASAMLTDSRIADIDGDGVPELIAPDRFPDASGTAGYGLYKWSTALADYSRTIPPDPLWAPYKSGLSSNAEQPVFLADFDGDGLPDLVQARHQYIVDPTCQDSPVAGRPKCLGYDWFFSHNVGNGDFFPHYSLTDQDMPIFTSVFTDFPTPGDIYFAPFSSSPFPALTTSDSAGRAHLFVAAKYSANTSGQVMRLIVRPGENMPRESPESLDSENLCAFGDFQGRGSYQKECFDSTSALPALPPSYWRISTFDVDADGREDLLAYNHGTDANGQFHVTGGSYRVYYDVAGVRHQDPITQIPLVGGDFDGDGIQDAYLYDRSTGTSYVGIQAKPTRDLMSAVADETLEDRPTEKVIYSQRWSADSVAPIACQHPQRCLRRGMNVVAEHDVYQGADVDAYEHHLYTYDDPRTDVHGGGFLGFATVREWNPDRPSETITTYDNTPTTKPGIYRSFLPVVERTYVPVDPIDPADKRSSPETLKVRISETTSHYQLHLPFPAAGFPSFAGKTHFFYRDAWASTEWESSAKLIWSPAERISNHFTESSPPQPALRVRNGYREVNDYGNEIYSQVSTVGGVSVEVTTDYEQDVPQLFYLDRIKTRQTTVTGPNSAAVPEPRRVDYTYDALGHLTSVSVEENRTSDPDVQSKLEFDYTNGRGLATKITKTAPGEVPRHTFIEYDPDEGIFPRKTWNDLGHVSSSLYHPMFGVLSDYIDANGVDTQVQLDDFGRVVQTVRAGQAATAETTVYHARKNNKGELIGTTIETVGLGIIRTLVTLDSLGRVVLDEHTGFDGLPIIRQTDYDTLGRVVSSRRPVTLFPGQTYLPTQDATSYAYDPMNRLRSIVAPDKSTVTQTPTFWRTDTIGPVPALPVPGFVAPHSYVVRDVDGRVVTSAQVSSTGDVATTFLYGDFNELLTVTDPTTQNVTKMKYDQLGRRKVLEDPDTGTSTLHYNGFGELTGIDAPSVGASPEPTSTSYAHDVLGRITEVKSSDGTTNFTWDTSPNGLGKLASRSSPEGTSETFTYNALGQLAQQTWQVPRDALPAESFDVLMGYDTSGRLSTLTYPDVPGRPARFKVQRSYVNGYLQQIGPYALPGLPAPTPFWTVNARNSDDQLLAGTTGNHVMESRTYYPKTGRLSTILAGSNASPVPALSLSYTYWPDGAVKSRVDSSRNRSETFDYNDGLSRLTGWHLASGDTTRDVGYHYDTIGNLDQVTNNNIVTETNTADPKLPHALATTVRSGVTSTFKHDARGRQYSTPDRQVVFTEHNLPKTVTTTAGTTYFLYDATGQRVKKSDTTSETVSLGGLYERRRSGSRIQHVFHVHGTDGHLAQISYDEVTKAELREYVHPDALGSASAITDDFKGAVRLDNEPFGKRIQPNGTNFSGNAPNVQLGFTGHQMDDDLGLVNMKGPIYDPSQRRFISPDPFVPRPLNAQSYNRYSYVYNNPLNLTDPSGFIGEGSESTTCDPRITSCNPDDYDDPTKDSPDYGTVVDNPNAAVCGGTSGRSCGIPPPAPKHEAPAPSVASKFHTVSVPVLDAVVNSDAITVTKTPTYRDGNRGTIEASPPPPFQRARQALAIARVLDPRLDGALGFVESIDAQVVEPVRDWVTDMSDGGRMRDHSEAMTGALGTVVLTFIMPGEAGGATALRELSWSSKSLRQAASALDLGSTEISVASRAEAEELFLGRYQAEGYRNTTGWSPKEVKEFFGSKRGTYHWDEGTNAFPHDGSHLQIHSFEREVIRIFFP